MAAPEHATIASSADGGRQDFPLLQMRKPPRERLFRVDAGIEPRLPDLDRAEERRGRVRSGEGKLSELPRSADERVQRQRLKTIAFDDLEPRSLLARHDLVQRHWVRESDRHREG